jgi:signal transduction histidine kinase
LERGVDVSTDTGRQVVALDASMRTDELITKGAAYLVIVVATKNEQTLLPYISNLAVLQEVVGRFSSFATQQQIDLYTQAQTELQKRFGTQEFTATPDVNPLQSLGQVPLSTVFPALEAVVGPGRIVSNRIIEDVTDQVADTERSALTAAYAVGGASVLVLILVTLLSIAVARSVVRPLTRLTRSADRVARVTEEELVRVADDETDAPGTIHLDPVDVRAKDEIGDLARAFERVQGTAASLVERQVSIRRNVAQMFGHVGRRTQNLVARQIALIDRLENEETDPQRLQHLYRLDHVSSRLRRNAGSLVVLSGATGANEHLNPLPLGDVVRLALGEIEDYTRVDVRVPDELSLVPAAVNDIVLVLAELMENAAVFSPPHTRIMVSAMATPHGARVAIADHGIGMSEEQLAQENARLQRRERLDLAPTGVLGLFVVGRLARRHGLAVMLAPTLGGGVTAMVDLPDRLLAAPWSATPALMATTVPMTPSGLPGRVEYRPVIEGTATVAASGAPGFNLAAVDRASRSIATGTSWSAFVPRQRASSLTRRAETVARGSAAAAGSPRQAPARELRQRVPGAQMPTGTSTGSVMRAPAPADAVTARAVVEDIEAGVRRAQGQASAPATTPTQPATPAASATATPTRPAPARAIPAQASPVQAGSPQTSPATTGPATTGPATTGPATTGPARTGPAPTSPARPSPVPTSPAQTAPAQAPAQSTAAPVQASPGQASPVQAGQAQPVPAAPPAPTVPVAPQPAGRPAGPSNGVVAPAARPQPVPSSTPLTRRQPGATLEGQPDLTRVSRPPAAQQAPNPDEARDLVEQFEAGVFRALGEVRSQHQREEGSSR